jgi:hypothetical protein
VLPFVKKYRGSDDNINLYVKNTPQIWTPLHKLKFTYVMQSEKLKIINMYENNIE